MGCAEVTVVLICGPAEHLFEDALASIVTQTHPGVRVLFHEVGGTSSYRARIERAARRLGGAVVSTPPAHLGGASDLEVLRRVTTRHVAFLEDAAAYYPAKLAVGLAALEGARYVLTGVETPDDAAEPPPRGGAEPAALVGGFFGFGPRPHRSALMMETALAFDLGLAGAVGGQASEALLLVRLLLDRALGGRVLPSRLTVRREAANPDMGEDAQVELFREVARRCDDAQLAAVVDARPEGGPALVDRSALLVEAGLRFAAATSPRCRLAAFCLGEASSADPAATARLVRRRTGRSVDRILADLDRPGRWPSGGVTTRTPALIGSFAGLLGRMAPRPRLETVTSSERHAPPPLSFGEEALFSSPVLAPYLTEGFSEAEAWGRWTDGPVARIVLPHPPRRGRLRLTLHPEMTFRAEGARLGLSVDGSPFRDVTAVAGQAIVVTTPGRRLAKRQRLELELRIDAPKSAGEPPGAETRALGVGFRALRLEDASA